LAVHTAGARIDIRICHETKFRLSGVSVQDLGANWISMGRPETWRLPASSVFIRVGKTSTSMEADPFNASVVYVGGDRQPGGGDGEPALPSIGAKELGARLFRFDPERITGKRSR
jgi:hypothetical protein